jgi:hypothetical protein
VTQSGFHYCTHKELPIDAKMSDTELRHRTSGKEKVQDGGKAPDVGKGSDTDKAVVSESDVEDRAIIGGDIASAIGQVTTNYIYLK